MIIYLQRHAGRPLKLLDSVGCNLTYQGKTRSATVSPGQLKKKKGFFFTL